MQLSAISLALTRIYGGGVAAFSPSSLFASGEVGVFFDPSDLSTMFQDSTGTTPVTADGQPVGLILDKSKGLVLGPELVTNGTFDTNTTGWTPNTATLSVVSNTLQVEWLSGVAFARQIVPTVIGKTYKFVVDCIKGTSSNFLIYLGPTAGSLAYANINGTVNKTYTYYFVATSTTCYIQCYCGTNSAGNNSRYDNISVKELAGNHATQATAASRPLYKTDGTKHWLQFDGVDDSLSTAAINFTATDKMSVFCGVKNEANSAVALLLETSSNFGTVDGGISLIVPNTTGGEISGGFHNETPNLYFNRRSKATMPVPQSYVMVLLMDTVALDAATIPLFDINSVQQTIGALSGQPTGNFGNFPLFIGRRDNSSYPFTGRVYSIIFRGVMSSSQEVSDTKGWITGKTDAISSAVALGDSIIASYAGSIDIFGGMVSQYQEINLAVSGNTISDQITYWKANYRQFPKWVGVQIGLNDLNPAEAASVALARLQTLVNDVRSGISSSAKILIGKLTPCRQRLIDIYGATDGPIAYQKWLDMNVAIGGGGATPITGVDVVASNHVADLNDGSGNLAVAYDTGDHIHPNNAGRQLISDSWVAALTSIGVTV